MPYRLITPAPRETREMLSSEPEKPKKHLPWRVLVVFVLTIFLIYVGFSLIKPLPVLTPQTQSLILPKAEAAQLPWPAYGQAALGAAGSGLLATHGSQTPVPMASVAKLVTALSVLKQKPLSLGQQGPKILITQADIASYDDYFVKGGSIVPVSNGELISQYQALQALLIPSANNFADTLARWAFGSIDSYNIYANQLMKSMGLNQTHIADASGFSAQTVSSAQDLVKLGLAVLDNPVIAQVSNQSEATIPVAGVIKNTNGQLGANGVIGLKTGNTEEAGGCYLFAAKRTIRNQPITVVGAIMAAPDLVTALLSATPLIQASDSGFASQTVIKAGQNLGSYRLPWPGSTSVKAKSDLSLLVWKGSSLHSVVKLLPIQPPKDKGALVGNVSVSSSYQTKRVPAILGQKIEAPTLSWRLLH